MPPKKKEDGAPVSAEAVLAKLQKAGMRIALDIPEQHWVSTGNMAIDSITNGGVPLGRICTFAGPKASGKTTTAVSAAGNVLAGGDSVVFYDYERAIDANYFHSLGVDTDDPRFIYAAPRTLEEGANATREFLRSSNPPKLFIFDSVARMITKKERDGDIETGMSLERAKLMYAFLRQAVDDAAEAGATLIFLNHLLEKVDISPMGQRMAAQGIKQYTMPGGQALPFYSSQILHFKKIGDKKVDQFNPLTNEEEIAKIGYEHEVHVAKNKLGKPELKARVINIMGEGFSQNRTAFALLENYGVIKKSGSWYSTKDERLVPYVGNGSVQGEENFYHAIFDNTDSRNVAVDAAQQFLTKLYDEAESHHEEEPELASL